MMHEMKGKPFWIATALAMVGYLVLDRLILPSVPLSEGSLLGLLKFTLILCFLSAVYQMFELLKKRSGPKK
jgi:hypothetical protein